MKLIINNGNKKIRLNVKKIGFFMRFLGLMFRTKNTPNLLFEFEKDTSISFHSFFVFFPFLVLWLDNKNKVINSRVVKPFCLNMKSKKPFRRVVEIPFNKRNMRLIRNFVG